MSHYHHISFTNTFPILMNLFAL